MLSPSDAECAALAWPSNVTFEGLLEHFVPKARHDRFAVNIGAQDGKTGDPCYSLFAAGYAGVVFEGDPNYFSRLHGYLAGVNSSGRVHVSWGYTSPAKVVPTLQSYRTPTDMDVLKVDIDSFDLDLTQAILVAGYRPKTLCVEINADIPPPIQWHRNYQ